MEFGADFRCVRAFCHPDERISGPKPSSLIPNNLGLGFWALWDFRLAVACFWFTGRVHMNGLHSDTLSPEVSTEV